MAHCRNGRNPVFDAQPGGGAPAKSVFIDWVGGTAQPYSILSDSASYTFVMQTNLVLEANFANNILLEAKGTYRGLFAPTNSFRQQTNSGSFSFILTSSGMASGNLDLSGETVPFSGRFNFGGTMKINGVLLQGQTNAQG